MDLLIVINLITLVRVISALEPRFDTDGKWSREFDTRLSFLLTPILPSHSGATAEQSQSGRQSQKKGE